MTSIKFRLNRSRLGKDGAYPLVVQIIRHRKKREIYTPFRLRKEEFDNCQEIVVRRTKGSKSESLARVNEYLTRLKKELDEVCELLDNSGKEYVAEDVVSCFMQHNDMGKVCVYINCLIEKLKSSNHRGTAANYQSAGNSFRSFVGHSLFTFDALTKQTIEEYQSYLVKKECSSNTVSFYIRQLKAIYNRALDDGVVTSDNNPFCKIRVKEEPTVKRAMTVKEIQKIASLDLTGKHPHLELVQDLFQFSLLTRGMSTIDMFYLTKENLCGGKICYFRKKTGQLLQIKVELPLERLIEKYASSSAYLLPVLRENDSYQNYRYMQRRLNKRIHEIGVMLNLPLPLTFYAARHSWATLARDEGVALSVISESLGHTSERTTRIYLSQVSHHMVDKANEFVISSWWKISKLEETLS